MTLQDYGKLVAGKKCKWCGAELPSSIDRYDHDYGWKVEGFDRLQWLSVQCPGCSYDWSLWKLDVPREEKEIQDGDASS